ncbi:MAG: response regulator, partial [Oscillospiraceae bacterium]
MQYTMVIADDEEIECKALGLLIKKECPQVHILGYAANGIELVHLLEKHRPDIAIVDINMPG